MAMLLAALVGAIVLAGSGAAPAQAGSGYEKEPVLIAKDLAGPELLKGPHFTVDPKVPVKGFIARFTIRSPFGKFEAGALVLTAPVDRVSWIEPLGRAVARPELQAAEKVAFLSGQMSPLAQKNVTSRGWRIHEAFTVAAER